MLCLVLPSWLLQPRLCSIPLRWLKRPLRAGRYPLNNAERSLLDEFGLDDAAKAQFEKNIYAVLGINGVKVGVLNEVLFSGSESTRKWLFRDDVLELLLAIAMLVVFTGVVVMVMQFTLRFFSAAESGRPNKLGASDGVLIDHGKLHSRWMFG